MPRGYRIDREGFDSDSDSDSGADLYGRFHCSYGGKEACPQDGLATGQVGTVVETHSPEAFDVEFLDSQGRTISLATLKRTEILVLRHQPAEAP